MTKVNKWTLGLAAVGLVSLPSMVQAEEKPNQLLTALSSTTISGYVDTSAHWTPGTGNANPPAFSFNGPSKQDGFNVNVVNVVIEKPLDEGTWSAGYKVDLLFGPNAVAYNASAGAATGDTGIKQAYVALRAPVGNGIDIKIGTFDTIIGYEVFNAGSNPNYTRSWGYTIEPTEHTGILASYQFTKSIGASFGIANTHAAGINGRSGRTDEASKTYMASLTLTAPDSWGSLAGSGLYLGIVDGFNTFNDVTSYYIGTTLTTPWKALKVGASYDYAVLHDNNFGPAGYAQALGLYASVQATEKLSFHARAEWADLTDGYATGGSFNGFGTGGGVGGLPAEVLSFTGTVQYDLWANVLSRLEVRWDTAISGHGPFGGTVVGASGATQGGANEKNALLIAANIIYKF